jgi:predicted permease
MRFLDKFRMAIRSLLRRTGIDQEIDDELQYHIDRQIEENLASGMNPTEASRAAHISFAGYQQRKEECRDMRGLNLIDSFVHDLRFAARQLRGTPGFTVTAILVLALGICSSVSVFAFVDTALLRPLPYHDPARLVGVFERGPGFPQGGLSHPDYLDWKRLSAVFSQLEACRHMPFRVSTTSGAEPAMGASVTAGFFRVLGVQPALGRDFFDGEDLPGANRTVLLSNDTWKGRFGGDPGVIGQAVILDGNSYVIIGVMPPDFHLDGSDEFWTNLVPTGVCDGARDCRNLLGIGRLRDGVSLQQAVADVSLVAQRLEKEYPDSNRGQAASVVPIRDVIVGDIRAILLLLLGAVGLLLSIACVNISSLLLVRSESRRREISIRGALGASRLRLTLQFATEGLALVAISSLIGLTLATWTMRYLTHLIPWWFLRRNPFLNEVGVNFRVVAFTGVIALIAAVLFTATPALRACLWNSRCGPGFIGGAGRGSTGTTWRSLGSKLVALELAAAVVLLIGAALLGQSLYRLLRVDLGFHPDHLVALWVVSPELHRAQDDQTIELGRQIVERISNLPGVRSVGLTNSLPMSGDYTTPIRFVGRPYSRERNEIYERKVSSEYFKTLEARLLRGRQFTDADDRSSSRVAIVNQALANTCFPDQDPIGGQIGDMALTPASIRTIVGVVDDIREGPLEAPIGPAEYLPFNQRPSNDFGVAVRTFGRAQLIIPALRSAIKQVDSDILIFHPMAMEEAPQNSPEMYLRGSAVWLVGAFAIMALLLSLVGLFGVVAYSVGTRTREIGIRMALGARPRVVYGLILKEAGGMVAVGLLIGTACAVFGTRLIKDLLFGVGSWNLPTLIGVVLVLCTSALIASFIPARRAASVNPVETLRAE